MVRNRKIPWVSSGHWWRKRQRFNNRLMTEFR